VAGTPWKLPEAACESYGILLFLWAELAFFDSPSRPPTTTARFPIRSPEFIRQRVQYFRYQLYEALPRHIVHFFSIFDCESSSVDAGTSM
jgi:hypothetical protein